MFRYARQKGKKQRAKDKGQLNRVVNIALCLLPFAF
jgi:hypothetical protein